MGKSYRWVWALLVVGLLCTSCASGPACPTCPLLEFNLKVKEDQIIKGDADKPQAGKTWGRVELILFPKAGETWEVPNDSTKYSQDKNNPNGWTFVSSSNDSRSVPVVMLGNLNGDKTKIIIDSINISVWMDQDNVNALINDGLKIRLRLAGQPTNASAGFQVKGSIRQVKAEGNTNREICQVQFLLDNNQFANNNNTPTAISEPCASGKGCWSPCS